MKLSWSSIQYFLSCQRKYELAYVEKLAKKPSAEHRNMVQGSAFHAGIQAALLSSFEDPHKAADERLIEYAVRGARDYIRTATVANKTKRNWETRQDELDVEYYAMIDELKLVVPKMLRYHLPFIGIGKKWRVASVYELLGQGGEDVPVVEYEFSFNLNDEGDYLKGTIDSVLQDTETGEYVIFDWKTRASFPFDSLALIDGQLHLYAGVLNALGANVSRVMMYQVRTKIPAPAQLSTSKKNMGLPLTGRESYDTTWEVWAASLPAGLNSADYEAEMRPKMKTDDFYRRPVEGLVTETSSSLMFDNVYAALASIKAAKASGQPMAAALGSKACQFCDFAKLCANAFRYGGDPTPIIEADYMIREGFDGRPDNSE